MARFKKGEGGRKQGSRNKKTLFIERVYQRCLAQGFHPADPLIEIAMDESASSDLRIKACGELLGYIEGKQKDGKPIIPETPADSVDAARATMEKLEQLSKPLEPKPA